MSQQYDAEPAPPGPVPPPGAAAELVQQIVLLVDRGDPAPEAEGIAAAALASVAAFIAAPEAAGWRPWAEGSFAKAVRRADAKAFAKVRDGFPDHALAASGAGRAIAFEPVAADAVPPRIRKLQVSGTELPRATPAGHAVPAERGAKGGGAPGAGPGAAPSGDPAGLVVVLNDALGMSTGKAAAQAAHALFAWLLAADPARLDAWLRAGRPLAVRRLDAAAFDQAVAVSGAGPLIQDAGRTEIAPGSATACVVDDVERFA
ncbi:peptidyl-tRNA hydrolase [Zafaria sp. J156]|uniref:peptidyl-tRNA hydrolase n=1 Tax=Zafaria sp. J156 TaxID=3116490 RepID=UPI002E76893E|nr:peptidyl-tRNA hydrolase [Zafaria sp. J156]MEE1620936.1 peptidyl-tRNA hydrolase [Zafaria sp. J156]